VAKANAGSGAKAQTRLRTETERFRSGLNEAAHGMRFFFVDVEDRVELRNLQQVFHALGQAQQFQRSAAFATVVNPETSSPIPELSM